MRHQVIAISELQSGFQKNSLQGVVVMARFTQDERECGWSPSFLWLLICICNHSHKFSCFIQHKCVSLNFWPIGWRCIVKGQTRLVHPGGMRRHSMSLPLLPVLLCLLLLSLPVYHSNLCCHQHISLSSAWVSSSILLTRIVVILCR